MLLILLFLALAYHYAMAIERRVARRYPADTHAVVAVTHLALLLVAVLMLPINPFSLALVVPAALLWPLARPGSWARSRLPVWAGLAVVAVALVYFGERLHLGWGVWWYFFLLLETRAIPVGARDRVGRLRRLGGAARSRAALAADRAPAGTPRPTCGIGPRGGRDAPGRPQARVATSVATRAQTSAKPP